MSAKQRRPVIRFPGPVLKIIRSYMDECEKLSNENRQLSQTHKDMRDQYEKLVRDLKAATERQQQMVDAVTGALQELCNQQPILHQPAPLLEQAPLVGTLRTVSGETHRLRSENAELNSRINNLLNELAHTKTNLTDTFVSGGVRVEEIAVRYRAYRSDQIDVFCRRLISQLFTQNGASGDGEKKREAFLRIEPILAEAILGRHLTMWIAERVSNSLRDLNAMIEPLPLEHCWLESLSALSQQMGALAKSDYAKTIQAVPSEPVASTDTPKKADAARAIGNHTANEADKLQPKPIEGGEDHGLAEPGTAEEILQTLYSALDISTSIPLPPDLLSSLKKSIETGKQLARNMTSITPPGRLWYPQAGECANEKDHYVVAGPPEGIIDYVVWPGFRVAGVLYESARVVTKLA